MNKSNIEIITLIYKSIDYLHLICEQLKSDNCKVDGWDIGVRVVLNDATDEIKEEIKNLDINYTIFDNVDPNEYYINRVYKAYNYGAITSEYDNICFVNSDNIFSKNWLSNILKYHNGSNLPCSRLIESGKMSSGKYGISQNFGKNPKTINYDKWEQYVEQISIQEIHVGGLYMPCIFEKDIFIKSGMYPEGNIYNTGIGNFGDTFMDSGDSYFFKKIIKEYNLNHITVFDSLVYHIQEGEKDEK